MTSERPTVAFVLGLVGGLIILVTGVLVSVILLIFSSTPPGPLWAFEELFTILDGVGVIIGAVLTYMNPRNHITWSVMVVVLSAASWITFSFGGARVGLILGLLGGSFGIAWKPSASTHLQPQ